MSKATLYVGFESTVTDLYEFPVSREQLEELVDDTSVNSDGYTLEDVLTNREALLDIIVAAYNQQLISPTDIQETFREETGRFLESPQTFPILGGVEQ